MTKSSKNISLKTTDKQSRSAKALRANLQKRKSQSRNRLQIAKDKNKEPLDG